MYIYHPYIYFYIYIYINVKTLDLIILENLLRDVTTESINICASNFELIWNIRCSGLYFFLLEVVDH